MTEECFRIYVEQLRDGNIEMLREELAPDFIDVSEKDLKFVDPVHLNGEAYLADDDLVLLLKCTTYATMPCAICNELIKHPVIVQGDYQMVPLKEIKTGIFDFKELLREAILLETPNSTECHNGKCPQRAQIQQYIKNEKSDGTGDTYQPFADLDKHLK